MTQPDDLLILREKPFCEAVSKLEELLAQSGKTFLMGAGCSKAAGMPLTEELTEKVLASKLLAAATVEILTALQDQFKGAKAANIEDYLSELIDLLAISERRVARGATQKEILLAGSSYKASQVRDAIEEIKRAIAEAMECKFSIETHRQFIKAVHRPLRPGKSTFNQTINYLILNYDTLLEDVLALDRLPFADGIEGGATGWWNPATFDRDGLAARIFKLHGSIDWCSVPGDSLPRRIRKSIDPISADQRRILLWPASTKYRETQLDPYAQLMDSARKVLRPPPGSQCVLLVCGYRFGDSHINLEIDQALRESDKRLTIVAFTFEDELSGQLDAWNKDPAVTEQVLVFGKRGFFHGEEVARSEKDLPWWKFENVTRLLGGER